MTAELTMAQKIIATAIAAMLAWVTYTTQVTATKVEVIQAKLDAATDDRYRAADAARDLALRDQRINGLSDRLAQIERVKD